MHCTSYSPKQQFPRPCSLLLYIRKSRSLHIFPTVIFTIIHLYLDNIALPSPNTRLWVFTISISTAVIRIRIFTLNLRITIRRLSLHPCAVIFLYPSYHLRLYHNNQNQWLHITPGSFPLRTITIEDPFTLNLTTYPHISGGFHYYNHLHIFQVCHKKTNNHPLYIAQNNYWQTIFFFRRFSNIAPHHQSIFFQ